MKRLASLALLLGFLLAGCAHHYDGTTGATKHSKKDAAPCTECAPAK